MPPKTLKSGPRLLVLGGFAVLASTVGPPKALKSGPRLLVLRGAARPVPCYPKKTSASA